ncbi:MAG: hypothetical protein KGN37_17070 [Burkholderiales bacterium]|nr:hypothetical protein [Burkholderiales bacterium]
MKISGLVRGISVSLVAAATLVLATDLVQAQTTTGSPLFPKGLSGIERNRMFMRLGYTTAFIKTKSGDAYDVTGPVVSKADLTAAATLGDNDAALAAIGRSDLSTSNFDVDPTGTYALAVGALNAAIGPNGVGLGTPPGIKAKSGNAGTPTLSMGYWLDDEYRWAVEAFVLAVPLTVKAYGDGINPSGKPNGLNGKEIITTKLLPPMVVASRYFGGKDSLIRPYLGVGAMYGIFFDSKSTDVLNVYEGNKTSVSLKNAFGVGPFAGMIGQLTDQWHLNLSVGQIQLRTKATLTTSNTIIKTGAPVTFDYSKSVVTAIQIKGTDIDTQMTTKLMELVALSKGQSDLGSFVRKQDQKFTNTIVTVSVGRSF